MRVFRKARKPNELVQPNLRIREDLRRRLELEAKKHGRSLNSEMGRRLEESFRSQIDADLRTFLRSEFDALHRKL